MNAPKVDLEVQPLASPPYGAYGQLVKMLLPSSGCFAIHAIDGDLVWCSDGFERPDFRELLEEMRRGEPGPAANQGQLRKTAAGVSIVIARLSDGDGTALGFVLIELRGAATAAASSMSISLTRPLFTALAAQLALAQQGAKPSATPAAPVALAAPQGDVRLEFLLGAAEIDLASPHAVKHLLQRCVDQLNCLSAALCIPDLELTEVAERAAPTDEATRARLEATRRHLLAWAQLNNRPMVVNRIDEAKSPYKILSAPVPSPDGRTGLLALFRAADGPNFELDDVRLIEFMGRLALTLLKERRDGLTGFMTRASFERYLGSPDESGESRKLGTLLCFDVLALRDINAAFSFRVGDEAIVRAAQLIRRSLAPQEASCRLSGDSFVVHLPGRDPAAAAELGAAIAQAAAELGFSAGGKRVPLALAWGAAPAAAAATPDARHWIAAAELACRQSTTNRAKPSL